MRLDLAAVEHDHAVARPDLVDQMGGPQDGQMPVTAQLVDAASDSQRWSERFDREPALEHVFSIQDDIARAVTRALRGALG